MTTLDTSVSHLSSAIPMSRGSFEVFLRQVCINRRKVMEHEKRGRGTGKSDS